VRDAGSAHEPASARDAPPTALPTAIDAEQLEQRAHVWLSVWLLQPHVHEEEREEVLAGLGEALKASE